MHYTSTYGSELSKGQPIVKKILTTRKTYFIFLCDKYAIELQQPTSTQKSVTNTKPDTEKFSIQCITDSNRLKLSPSHKPEFLIHVYLKLVSTYI